MSCSTSELYHELLNHSVALEKIYACMQKGDFAELVMTATEILKETKTMPLFDKKWKCEVGSAALREEGNKAYFVGKYQTALKWYNQALLRAPVRSKAMLLAYSNRSALFHKTRNYTASLKDIDTCLKFDCNKDIIEKLTKRKIDCQKNLWREKCNYGGYFANYFKIEGKKHPQIPCATDDVKIIIDPITQLPKITAAKDIKVGTVVAVEPVFTSLLIPMNYFLCCYYCHKMSLNLVPCSNCMYALFCDNNECRQKCLQEIHNVECYIMEILQGGFCGPYCKVAFRTVLKIKNMCSTWNEFIEASNCIGEERIRNSSVEEIYDHNHKFSMLNFIELREIKTSSLYNFAFMCATFLEHLIKMPFYLPNKVGQREEAIHAIARMSMALLLKFWNKIDLNNVAEDRHQGLLNGLIPNNGYFSFASKLKHDCFGNLLAIGLNHKVGLVALQPIKKGTELTMSYIDHAYDFIHSPRFGNKERIIELYRFAKICYCPACTGTWGSSATLSDAQRRQYRRWMVQVYGADLTSQNFSNFKSTCELLSSLQGLCHTTEFKTVYFKFRALLAISQFLETRNYGPHEEECI